jgi:hypothetical protein
MPIAKKTRPASAAKPKKASSTKSAKTAKKKAAAASSLDWSATIKKAAEEKRSQASWPGTGDAWKKKVR